MQSQPLIKTEKEVRIMLKLAEILMQEKLISPEEKYRLVRLIRKDGRL